MRFSMFLGVPVFVLLYSSCSSDESTQASQTPTICFSVSGFNVSVRNMWKSGEVYTTNVQGLASFNETISRNNESHSLSWTNISNNYTTNTVTSFNVKIDGKDYSYPANRCN